MKKNLKFFIIILIISFSLASCTRLVYSTYLTSNATYHMITDEKEDPPVYDFKTLDELCRNYDRVDICFRIAQTFQVMRNPKMYEYYELAIKKGYKTKLSPEELAKYYEDKYTNIINNKGFKSTDLDCDSWIKDTIGCYYYNRYYCRNCLSCKKEELTISSYYGKYEKLKSEYEELTDPNNQCNQKNTDKNNCYSRDDIRWLKQNYKKCERYLRKYGWL